MRASFATALDMAEKLTSCDVPRKKHPPPVSFAIFERPESPACRSQELPPARPTLTVQRSFGSSGNPDVIWCENLRIRKFGLDVYSLETRFLPGHCLENHVV